MPHDRKRKPKNPCPKCLINIHFCVCELIPELDLKTRVSLVIHKNELRRSTNTGLLAVHSLKNSHSLVRGRENEQLDLSELIDDTYENVLFFPDDHATELNEEYVEKLKKPLHLIVPDGNWRQASKVHYRHKEIAHLPRVMMRPKLKPQMRMRAESTDHGMATLESLAYALGLLEGQEVQLKLLKLYEAKRVHTLRSRGMIRHSQNETLSSI